MSGTPVAASLHDLDALPAASMGTALTAAASLVWPSLLAGATALAVLTGFVVWTRLLRALRQRTGPGRTSRRLLPLLAVTAGGWAAALATGPATAPMRAVVLVALALGLWGLVRRAGVGATR